MPELPEVETVVRDLRPLLAGRTITRVWASKPALRRAWNKKWEKELVGVGFGELKRRGKWILLPLSPGGEGSGVRGTGKTTTPPPPLRGRSASAQHEPGGGSAGISTPLPPPPTVSATSPSRGEVGNVLPLTPDHSPPGERGTLLVHLGMTGQFTVVPNTTPVELHTHRVFDLDNETQLRFRDVRRFGSMELYPTEAAALANLGEKLGPEPFDIPAAAFAANVRSSKRTLKAILLDQSVVAGVGNIYADEALFRSGLHPERRGNTLTVAECDRLRAAIEAVIARAIEYRGSTIRDYVGGSGLRGGFQDEFAVYGRTGEKCVTCEGEIERVVVGGRSSHFCARCQPRL